MIDGRGRNLEHLTIALARVPSMDGKLWTGPFIDDKG
jgi:hypothetical protein